MRELEYFDYPLETLRIRAYQFHCKRKRGRERDWVYYNTFLGRRVERNSRSGNFRILGGQVVVTA